MIKNIFFDFDGVLAESVNVKTQAFGRLYECFGNAVVDKVIEYHLNNGGVNRYDKIRYFHTNFLGKELDDNELKEWCDRFSKLVLEGVIDSEEVKGATYFLDNYRLKYKFWIITGTPTEEIRLILDSRQMSGYFVDAFGSPEKKYYWTEQILKSHALNPVETLFIGDAEADKEAADKSKLHFILRRNKENIQLFKDYNGHVIHDLFELPDCIAKVDSI